MPIIIYFWGKSTIYWCMFELHKEEGGHSIVPHNLYSQCISSTESSLHGIPRVDDTLKQEDVSSCAQWWHTSRKGNLGTTASECTRPQRIAVMEIPYPCPSSTLVPRSQPNQRTNIRMKHIDLLVTPKAVFTCLKSSHLVLSSLHVRLLQAFSGIRENNIV